jgi:MFS family permease
MVKVREPSVFRIETRNAFRSVMLVVNPLVWYSAVIYFLQNQLSQMSSSGVLTSTDSVLVWCIHFAGIIFAAFAGTLLTKKIEKKRFLIFWMSLGAVSSISIFAINIASMPIIGLIVLLLGVSLGLGMPICMGYYTDCVPIEYRGRMSGAVMLFTIIGVFAFTIFPSSNPIILGTILAVWRLSSLIVFNLFKSAEPTIQEKDATDYRTVLSHQPLFLYLIPWVMFSLVNYLAAPIQTDLVGKETIFTMTIIQNVLMGIFAVIGGFLLDSVGRKRIAICGFVLLGIDAATLGLFPREIWANYFSATVDGVAWGFLFVIFIVTIWGDLSRNTNSSKYYAIGVLPFFVSKFLALTVGASISNFIFENAGRENGLFSFLAFFLFVAILPLVYAPETLPEKVMKDRDLKSYVEKAKKKVQVENEKQKFSPNKKPEENPLETAALEAPSKTDSEESDKERKAMEEAERLADKYY